MPRRSSWLKRYLKAEIGVAETPGAIYKTTLGVLIVFAKHEVMCHSSAYYAFHYKVL